MTEQMSRVLVVGASGSIGRLAVAQALEAGIETRALVRDRGRPATVVTELEAVKTWKRR
jgi:uncharacterized protein YbjT (DUF2867 family)